MADRRIAAGGAPAPTRITARTATAPGAPAPEAAAKSHRPLRTVVVTAAVLALAGGAYVAGTSGAVHVPGLSRPSAHATTSATPAKEPAGPVVDVESKSVNLADGHYLRIGLGLQMDDKVDPSKTPSTDPAVHQMLAVFTGRSVTELGDPATREALRQQLLTALAGPYKGHLLDVYYTDFVTQ